MEYIALIFYAAAVIDFILSWLGINLTYFLGEASRFSPLILGGIGFLLQKMAEPTGPSRRVKRKKK